MEPLAVFEQAQTGEVIIRGLRRRIVYDETVQAACEGGVGDHLDIAGIICVGALPFSVHGERLCGADVLSVDMCHGCTLAYVGNGRGQHGARKTVGHPDGRHGHACILLRVHTVPHEGPAGFVGLDISTFHPVLGDYLAQAVVILSKKLTYSLAPVAHELLAAGGAPDDTACKHGQPGK